MTESNRIDAYEAFEARAKHLSHAGLKLKLEPTAMQGWQWETMLGPMIVEKGYTDNKHKAMALWLAFQINL